jgi:hypothetical protein
MQDREKKLAIGLGIVVVLAFGLPLFERWFLEPITDARNLLASTQEKVVTLETSAGLLKRAQRNLDDWQYESLPPNPFTAQREYQQWLMDLARMSQFENPVPTLLNVPQSPGRGTFIEIPVTIQAKADLGQLARFLYHFERAALLHQVQRIEIKSPVAVGNPKMDVTIAARGLSLVDSPPKSRLFPTTILQEDLSAAGDMLKIASLEGFPLVEGFQIKVNEELMIVRERSENQLIVERGAEATRALLHPEGSYVELFPVDRELFQRGHSFEEYLDLLENSPFIKPAPPVDYKPQLAPATPQIVTRGEPWKLKVALSGWNPAGGPAVFALDGEVPEGLTLDESSGELAWNPGSDVPVGRYEVSVMARSDIMSDQQVSLKLPVTLREPNLPPVIDPIEPLTAFSGRPLSFEVKAQDPDGDDRALQYSLGGEVPAGAAIDRSGLVQWTPPLTLELGEYKLQIQVADTGDPKKTTTREVAVTLEDDAALFTQLTGFFSAGDKPEAMLRNLSSGKTSRLSEGDEVSAAEIHGTIVGIEPSHIVLQVGEQKYRLNLGNNLRQMTPISDGASTPAGDETPAES